MVISAYDLGKIDGVLRNNVLELGKLKEDFKATFESDNNATMEKVIWLSGQKSYGSMIIYLTNKEDALRLLHQGIVQLKGEVSFTSEYHHIERPIRCRNCQRYGHKAAKCRNPPACEKCAGPHLVNECTEAKVHCAACDGNHRASHPECSKWLEEKAKIKAPVGNATRTSPTAPSY